MGIDCRRGERGDQAREREKLVLTAVGLRICVRITKGSSLLPRGGTAGTTPGAAVIITPRAGRRKGI